MIMQAAAAYFIMIMMLPFTISKGIWRGQARARASKPNKSSQSRGPAPRPAQRLAPALVLTVLCKRVPVNNNTGGNNFN